MMSNSSVNDSTNENDIAVVGLTCRFPGARNVDEFWQNLRDGVESVTYFTDEELEASGVDRAILRRLNYVKAGALLDGADLFDASFFGITPREAELIDPQHRIFLECAWEALEHAGYNVETYDGWIGVYAGAGFNSYLSNQLHSNLELLTSMGHLQALISNEKDYLTSRVSYKLNLKGPSVNVQTACSTSLVAVHLSCQSLLTHQCDIALAGGVSVHAPQKAGYLYVEDGIQSPDGHTRSFDARGQGTLFGSGVGVVVLKRLTDALEDGDTIHAVIKGTAINNDGALKVGYTAPSVDGLSKVIAVALGNAEVSPESISYVEAHGTATALGDPVEIAALNKAFRSLRGKGVCALGSVKSNFGHLNVAAGVAGLIKTILALKHRQIPPSLHFDRPNPDADWENSAFNVNTELSEWERGKWPRRAGVNSMGIGGTNAHVVVEEAPEACAPGVSRPWQLLALSAKTETALESATERLAAHLESNPEENLADVAYTLQVGRKGFAHRRVLACRDAQDAATRLRARDPRRVFDGQRTDEDHPLVFLFPGQGAQHVNAGRALYEGEPVFRRQVDKCAALLSPHLGFDLRGVLYPPAGREEEAGERLKQTSLAQPALFVVEHALASLLISWGVRPWAMVGHSIGEYVAACIAGVFTLEEGLRLVCARGRLMQGVAAGSMLAVSLPASELDGLLPGALSLAATNGERQCVVSGRDEDVAEFERQLAARGVECRRLHTSHAFHSGMMDGILDAFAGEVGRVALRAPQIPYVSNVTGEWITAAETTDANYWVRHLRRTVRFAESVRFLLNERAPAFVEVGPGETLGSMVRQLAGKGATVLSTFGHRREADGAHEHLLQTVGRLWSQGCEVNWDTYNAGESRRRVPLPTYPFERQRFWVEAQRRAAEVAGAQKSLRKKTDVAEWFYVPSWKRSVLPDLVDLNREADGEDGRDSCWLIFTDECGLGSALARCLEREGLTVLTIGAGELYARAGERSFNVNPRATADYDALLGEVDSLGLRVTHVVHAWGVTGGGERGDDDAAFERVQSLGFYSLLALAQSLGRHGGTDPLSIVVLTDDMQQVTGDEKLRPEKATVLGPCKVMPREYLHISCQSIDVQLPPRGSEDEARLIDALAAEVSAGSKDSVVAYRNRWRWVQTFEPHHLEQPNGSMLGLREGGVYLITGGLGGVGLVLAKHLAKSVRARLVLVGRTSFPPRESWARWLSEHGETDEVSARIRKLQELESYGAEVVVERADVTDEAQMRGVLERAASLYGQVNGVVHAAGVPGGGLIQLKTPETAAHILAPKVQGTRVLGKVFAGGGLDFMLLCSSRIAVLGRFGQVDYCAANTFLDAFAHYNTAEGHAYTVAVDWDGWQDVGMLVEAAARYTVNSGEGETAADKSLYQESIEAGIAPHEGADAFARIVARKISPQVVVSTKDLAASFEHAGALTHERVSQEIGKLQTEKPGLLHPRPDVQTDYAAPTNELEQSIADIWQTLFSIERVGVHDDFFELGGNSLLGLQLISRLRETFQVEIPLGHLFESPTVLHLSQLISEKFAQKETPDAMAELLAELDGLSEEEALRQLDAGAL
jgi:acyl transferase domain-containing protein/acyl carrier protein